MRGAGGLPERGHPEYDSIRRVINGWWRGWHGARFRNANGNLYVKFLDGKSKKRDVQEFQLHLMDNILSLRADLINGTYRHGGYEHFKISDPKPRDIHKASVRDRLVHHAIYRKLYPFFDRTFIADSFSCRLEKGPLVAINRFRSFARAASRNNTRTCWALKGDVRKFFANIDHATLMEMLASYIPDKKILTLLKEVIDSFSSTAPGVGLPLGNLTSQLFVNVYMNESANSSLADIGVTQSYLNQTKQDQQNGLTFVPLTAGQYKDMGNPNAPLTPEEKALFQRDLNITMQNFIDSVAQNRNLSVASVTAIANGSSMLGKMALQNGLIDKIGNIYDVEDYLKGKIGSDVTLCE